MNEVVELTSPADWAAGSALLAHMYPDRDPQEITDILTHMHDVEGWRAIGVFDDASDQWSVDSGQESGNREKNKEAAMSPRSGSPCEMQEHFAGQNKESPCIALLLLHVGWRLYSGKFMRIDSVAVHPDHRGKTFGKQLVDWTKNEARRLGCSLIMLDSYVDNFDGHRFFYREDFFTRGYHMIHPLQEDALRGIPSTHK